MPTFDNLTAMELLILKYKNKKAILFVASIFVLICVRNYMWNRIEKKLGAFYENTMSNYEGV